MVVCMRIVQPPDAQEYCPNEKEWMVKCVCHVRIMITNSGTRQSITTESLTSAGVPAQKSCHSEAECTSQL